MFDRRKFFKLFAAGAAGLTVAGKIALAEDIQNWMLSPQKTIFIPPEPKIVMAYPIFQLNDEGSKVFVSYLPRLQVYSQARSREVSWSLKIISTGSLNTKNINHQTEEALNEWLAYAK